MGSSLVEHDSTPVAGMMGTAVGIVGGVLAWTAFKADCSRAEQSSADAIRTAQLVHEFAAAPVALPEAAPMPQSPQG